MWKHQLRYMTRGRTKSRPIVPVTLRKYLRGISNIPALHPCVHMSPLHMAYKRKIPRERHFQQYTTVQTLALTMVAQKALTLVLMMAEQKALTMVAQKAVTKVQMMAEQKALTMKAVPKVDL